MSKVELILESKCPHCLNEDFTGNSIIMNREYRRNPEDGKFYLADEFLDTIICCKCGGAVLEFNCLSDEQVISDIWGRLDEK